MRNKIISIGVWVLMWCSVIAGSVFGQTPTDSQAYFQWMLAVTDDTLTPRMTAHLGTAGVRGNEASKAAQILSQFKAEEFGLEESYNNLPSTKSGSNDGTAAFYSRQAALVTSTIAKLKATLSADTFTALDARVQDQKKNLSAAKVHSHSRLTPVSMRTPPQGTNMNPNYSFYWTMSAALNQATLTSSMLNGNSCPTPFPQWNASNLVDGNTSTVGFATDTSQAWQSCFAVDLGTAQTVAGIGMYMSAGNYNGQFRILYWDQGSPSWMNASSNNFSPIEPGWNNFWWASVGAHRYWIVELANTPGAGPTINELQVILPGSMVYSTSQLTGTTNCVGSCPPATHTGRAYNNGVLIYGPGVSPPTFIDVQNNQSQLLCATCTTTAEGEGDVNCSQVGPIYNSYHPKYDIEQAYTYSANLFITCNPGPPPGYGCTQITDFCSITPINYNPPDYPPTRVMTAVPGNPGAIILSAYFYGWDIMDRLYNASPGTKWEGLFGPTNLPGMTIPETIPHRNACTNWDKGYTGPTGPGWPVPTP